MEENQPKQAARLSLTHPIIYVNVILALISGSFNTIGQKFLLSPDYGNYKHPVFATLCMFHGEFVNYLIFMLLCFTPSIFKKIVTTIYQNVHRFV